MADERLDERTAVWLHPDVEQCLQRAADPLPQFLAADRPVFPQALLLGTVVVLCAGTWWGLYITAVGTLRKPLARPTVRTAVDVGTGAALICLGGVLLL